MHDDYRAAERALWEHVGAEPRDVFLDLERPTLRVRLQELGYGPPTLFVHGGPNAGTTFAPLVAHLPERRCLLLDRPGCGLSEPVDYSSHDVRSLAVDTLRAVLDGLQLPRVDIVASSMGGLWSLWFALAHPERVGRMVQLGAPAGTPGMKTPAFMRAFATPGLSQLMTRKPPDRAMMERIMTWIGHARSVTEGRFSEAYFGWAVALGEHTRTMKHDTQLIRKIGNPVVGVRFRYRLQETELAKLSLPVLWIWGDADTFGGVDVLERAQRATPGSKKHVIPGAGHLPWLDEPKGVAALIDAHFAMAATAV